MSGSHANKQLIHAGLDSGKAAKASLGSTTRKKPVLLVLPSLQAGGSENYALRMISSAGSSRFQWHVLSIDSTKGDLHADFCKLGVHIHYGGIGYFNPARALRFYAFLKKNRIEAIMTFNGVFGGLPLTLAFFANVARRIGWHRRSSPAFKATLLRRLYARISLALMERFATAILSNSSAALEHYHRRSHKFGTHFRVIPNGIDTKKFRDHPEGKMEARSSLGLCLTEFIVGHVGRYDPAKNHQTIFEVAKILCSRDSSVTFLFCGKGTDSVAFRKELVRHGIVDKCKQLGLQSNMPRVYRSLDVFYFPSLTEGLSNALIEACVSGVPIVASSIPGNFAVMPRRTHDKLVPPTDVDAAIQSILDARRTPPEALNAIQDQACNEFELHKNMYLAIHELT